MAGAFAAQPASPPPLAQVGKPSAAETARILDQFRQSGWRGYVEFDLRALPLRGDETVYHGRLWGGRNDGGAVTRIEVTDAKGGVIRFLLQNGAHPGVWRAAAGKVAQLDPAAQLDPLIPGIEITAFDLQMPYLYWPSVTVESVQRVLGRPAYAILFRPLQPVGSGDQAVAVVRSYFDAQFGAPVQTELANSRRVTKTSALIDLKKVGDQWIPKSFDVRNSITRDKTRFEVTAVALGLDFADTVFAPASLLEDIRPPAANRITHLEQ